MRLSVLTTNSRLSITLALAAIVVGYGSFFHPVDTVEAFKPTAATRVHPGDITHTQITEEAIRELITNPNPSERIIPGINEITGSMRTAIERIKEGNYRVDLSRSYLEDGPHFTGEAFDGGKDFVRNQLAFAEASMQFNDVNSARRHLGSALHAVQDFYSHTNWIETNHNYIHPTLTQFDLPWAGLAGRFRRTCDNCAPFNCGFCENNIATAFLTSAYFQPSPFHPRKPVGKCSHGAAELLGGLLTPDFSVDDDATGGINKDSLDCATSPHNGWHIQATGLAKLHTKEVLRNMKTRLGLKKFKNLLGVSRSLAIVIDTTGSMNAELEGVKRSALRLLDEYLRANPGQNTASFILVDLNDPLVNLRANTNDDIVFRNEILKLRPAAGSDCPEPVNQAMLLALDFIAEGSELYVWTDADGKDNDQAYLVRHRAKMLDVQINFTLTGNCSGQYDPEFCRTADATGGQVFVMTPEEINAIPNNLDGLFSMALNPRSGDILNIRSVFSGVTRTYPIPIGTNMIQSTITVSGTGAANVVVRRPDGVIQLPGDPSARYIQTANGSIYIVSNPMAGIWSVSINGPAEPGFSACPVSTFTVGASAAPLKSAARIAASAASSNSNNESQDQTTAPSAANCGTCPAALPATSSASETDTVFSIRVTGESSTNLSFNYFDFATLSGTPEHSGYEPITGAPIAGQTSHVVAQISGQGINSAVFELRTVEGELLQALNLTELAGAPEDLVREFQGELTVPSVPFRVYVTGTDSNGAVYQQVLQKLFEPQLVKVSSLDTLDLLPGQISSTPVTVTNYGPADTFYISGLEEFYMAPLSASPASFALNTGETTTVTLQVETPITMPKGATDKVKVIALSATNANVNNYAEILARVTDEVVWVDDELPTSAVVDGESWDWSMGGYSGYAAHESATSQPTPHRHAFNGASLNVTAGDKLFTYVYLDPDNLPSEIMLEFNDGSWEHRAYWGANDIALGTDGTASRRYMGPLPAADSWVRLEIPASELNLGAQPVTGISYLMLGGRGAWDRSGKQLNLNPPPTITLVEPASSLVVDAPANLTISAQASDSNGTISQVEFYESDLLLGTITVPDANNLYSIVLNDIPAGPYTFRAVATDNGGMTKTSDLLGVFVNGPPEISITSPAADSIFASPANVLIDVSTSDPDYGFIRKVEFFQNGISLGEDPVEPFSLTWNGVGVGAYTLTAVATDNDGRVKTSPPITMTVGSGTVAGSVTNSDGTVPLAGAVVKVLQGTRTIGTATTDSAGHYEIYGVPAGSYEAEAAAIRYITEVRTAVAVAEETSTAVDFALDPLPPPTITAFTPTVGNVNTAVTISGTNFDSPPNDEIKFNATSATVTNATPTTITTAVPASAGSGRITVTTPTGTAVSAADFFIPPSPFTASDVEYTGRMNTGSVQTVAIGTQNKIGLLLFDGAVGQRISLKMTSVAFGSSTCCSVKVAIYNPNGTALVSPTSVGTTGGFFDTKTLAHNGTYTILVDPSSTNTGSLVLTLNDVPPDVTAPIIPGGPAVTVTTSVAGQNANLTFNGAAGQRVSLKFDNATFGSCNGKVYLYNPDGTLLTSDTCVVSGDFIDTKTLPASGLYTIFIDPASTVTGSLTSTLYDVPVDATSSITAGGPAVTTTTTVPGENARLLFNGAAGSRVSLLVNSTTYGGGNSAISILKPDGSVFASDTSAYAGDFIDALVLPVDGAYTIFIDPKSFHTGSISLSLHNASNYTAAITLNGVPVTVTIGSAGQNAEVTFTGLAGERISLGISGVTIGTSSCCSTYVSIKKPDGTDLLSVVDVGTSGNGSSTLTLPTTGTYTILVDPKGASTGSLTLTLSEEMTGSINIGGPSMALGFGRPGQNARIVFSGTEGERVSVGLSAVTIGTSSCCSTYLSVAKPDGAMLLTPIDVGTSGSGSNTLVLPVTGTFSIYIDPRGASTGNATLSVSAELSAGINIGGPSITLALTTPGQNALISFDGLAGQRVSVGFGSVTIGTSSCCSTYVSVLNPDGTTLLAPMDVGTSGNGTPTLTLPVTGTFSIFIDPRGASAGQVTVTLSEELSGPITIGAGSVPLSFRPGQNAQISFEGTAGQRVSLGLGGVTIGTSSCCSTYASIKNPNGSMLLPTIDVGTSGAGTNTLTLPASGTYQIVIDPRGASGGNITLTLSEEMTGTLTPGSGSVTFVFSRPGQNAQLTFVGTAAQRISLNLAGVTIGSSTCCSTYISLKNPDGTFLIPQTDVGTSGKFIDTKILPASGIYTLIVDPRNAFTGNVTVSLYDVPPDASGTTTIGGSPLSLTTSVPGQNGLITFTATSGQQASVALSGNSMGSVTVRLLRPDGTQLTSKTSGSSSFTLTTQTLPVTGTYSITIDPPGTNTGNISGSVQNAQAGMLRYFIDAFWEALVSVAA